ncbi:MAG: hypothetical protein ACPG4T_19315 [Nannocystaceae bacterium]
MRTIGHITLWLGILAASFISIRHAAAVDWFSYGVAAAVGLVGVILLRVTAQQQVGGSDKLQADVAVMGSSLTLLRDRLGSEVNTRSRGVYDVHGWIDADLAPTLAEFVDARESLIPAHGMQLYADVMTRFAAGERMVNRAWSASADGYIDEVWICLERARKSFSDALVTLEAGHDPAAAPV